MKRQVSAMTAWHGLPICIETHAGEDRNWYDPHTKRSGSTTMKYPYGYVEGTLGTDGDEVDVFLGPHRSAPNVYIVTQMKAPDFKTVDEQKCMLGFLDSEDAKQAYMAHYNKPGFFGHMTAMSLNEFKEKLKSCKGSLIKSLNDSQRSAKLLDTTFLVRSNMSQYSDALKKLQNLSKSLDSKQCEEDGEEIEKKYEGFAKVEHDIESKGKSAESAKKIAAAIGRKKYGAKAMASAAAKGKNLKGHATKKSLTDEAVELLNSTAETLSKAYASDAQRRYFHAAESRGEIDPKTVKEFDDKSKGKKLPEKVTKSADAEDEVEKSLKAISVLGLAKQARLHQFAAGQALDTNPVGTIRVRNPHETPVVPVRHVATPMQNLHIPGEAPEVFKSCDGCGTIHKSQQECPRCSHAHSITPAIPAWRR